VSLAAAFDRREFCDDQVRKMLEDEQRMAIGADTDLEMGALMKVPPIDAHGVGIQVRGDGLDDELPW
jgi:hypothetical protein